MELPTTRPGLVLIKLRPEDSKALFALINRNREHLSRFESITARDYPDHASVRRSIRKPANPDATRFGIWDKGMLMGSATFTLEAAEDLKAPKAHVDYWIGQEYVSHDYATPTLRTLGDYAFDERACSLIYAFVHQEDQERLSVLEACGFTYQSVVYRQVVRYVLDRKDR